MLHFPIPTDYGYDVYFRFPGSMRDFGHKAPADHSLPTIYLYHLLLLIYHHKESLSYPLLCLSVELLHTMSMHEKNVYLLQIHAIGAGCLLPSCYNIFTRADIY